MEVNLTILVIYFIVTLVRRLCGCYDLLYWLEGLIVTTIIRWLDIIIIYLLVELRSAVRLPCVTQPRSYKWTELPEKVENVLNFPSN